MSRTLSDMVLGGRFMAMFKGSYKTGKTIAAASWPKPLRIYDFDGRMAPLKLFYKNAPGISVQTVGPVSIPSHDIISYKEFCKEFEDLQDRCDFATVVLDSFTSLSNTAITFQLAVAGRSEKKIADKIGRLNAAGLRLPGFDEYNGETTSITQILDVAKILPCHFIMTAHPITKIETDGTRVKRVTTLASYGQKIASIAPAYFDEVYHFSMQPGLTEAEPTRRFILTQPDGDDFAGTALPLPRMIEITNRPLYPQVVKALDEYNATRPADAEAVKVVDQPELNANNPLAEA